MFPAPLPKDLKTCRVDSRVCSLKGSAQSGNFKYVYLTYRRFKEVENMSKTTCSGYAFVVMGIMMVVYVCLGLALASVVAFIPFYIRDLNLSFIQAGLLLTFSAIPLMFVGPLWQKYASKIGGHKNVVVLCMAILTVSTALMAFAPEFWSLMILRFILGFGLFSIFTVGAHITIPWFGFAQAAGNAPKLALAGVGGLLVGFFAPLFFFSAINVNYFNGNYNNFMLIFLAPIFAVVTLLALILIKEVKHT